MFQVDVMSPFAEFYVNMFFLAPTQYLSIIRQHGHLHDLYLRHIQMLSEVGIMNAIEDDA